MLRSTRTDVTPEKTQVKRKRVVLSLKEKLDIINAVKDGGSRVELAEKYDIGISTIADIIKRSSELQEYTGTNQKAMKCPTYHEMEDALYMWYQLMQSNGVPVTGALLCEKALGFNKMMNGDSAFKASHGWLHRFKVRRGIHLDNSHRKSEAGEACGGGGGGSAGAEAAMPSDEAIIQRCLVAVKSEFPQRAQPSAADDTPDAYLDCSTGFIRRTKKRKILVNKSRTNRLLSSIEDMKKRKLALEIEQLELRNHLCRIEIFQAERLNALAPSVYTESMHRNHAPAPLSEVYVANGRYTPSDVKLHSVLPTTPEDLEL